MWIFVLLGFGIVALAHTLPAPFWLDAMPDDTAVWRMPRTGPPTVYLTYDDGPNPATTPALLDVLAREGVPATFFLIDRHVTDETAPMVRRQFSEGHAVALHSSTRAVMLKSPDELAGLLDDWARRIHTLAGAYPCRLFRPHASWRGGEMYAGLRRHRYRLVGWGWMLWDFNWFRPRAGRATAERIEHRVRSGDILVMHDGDESDPRKEQAQTVAATAQLIPRLGARGFMFGTICQTGS